MACVIPVPNLTVFVSMVWLLEICSATDGVKMLNPEFVFWETCSLSSVVLLANPAAGVVCFLAAFILVLPQGKCPDLGEVNTKCLQ